MNNQVRCEKCGSNQFTMGEYILEPHNDLKINGITKYTYNRPFICVKCGHSHVIDLATTTNKDLTIKLTLTVLKNLKNP